MVKYGTLLFLLLFGLTASAQLRVENDSIIIWNKNRKITWKDFLSENKVHEYKNAGAVLVPCIVIYPKKFDCRDLDYIKVVAQMDKTKSWVKIKTEEILAHEQVHFDIAELYARKIRKAIAEFIEESEECDLQGIADIYYLLEEEHWQTQFLYDKETDRGGALDVQERWNNKIAYELEAYKDYVQIIDIKDLEME